jgi:hypothetical protein
VAARRGITECLVLSQDHGVRNLVPDKSIAMIDKTISPLRQRMIEDMTIRHFKEKVQKDYIRQVKNFTVFLGRSPDMSIARLSRCGSSSR